MSGLNLKNLEIVILLDHSGSMGDPMPRSSKTRWKAAEETIVAIARDVEPFDPDGLTVIPFNNRCDKVYDNVTASKVADVFKEVKPGGGTNTELALQKAFDRLEKTMAAGRSLCVICLTDGEPNDRKAVKDTIIKATQRMSKDEELAVQFLQVGDSADAASFLKDLDDGLVALGAKFDVVDTSTLDEAADLTTEQLLEKTFAD